MSPPESRSARKRRAILSGATVVFLREGYASNVVQQEILALGRTDDLEADLRALARRQLGLVMQPHLLRLRRLVIAELARFPALRRIDHAVRTFLAAYRP